MSASTSSQLGQWSNMIHRENERGGAGRRSGLAGVESFRLPGEEDDEQEQEGQGARAQA